MSDLPGGTRLVKHGLRSAYWTYCYRPTVGHQWLQPPVVRPAIALSGAEITCLECLARR